MQSTQQLEPHWLLLIAHCTFPPVRCPMLNQLQESHLASVTSSSCQAGAPAGLRDFTNSETRQVDVQERIIDIAKELAYRAKVKELNDGQIPKPPNDTEWIPPHPDVREGDFKTSMSSAQAILDENVAKDIINGKIDLQDPGMISLHEIVKGFAEFVEMKRAMNQVASTHPLANAVYQAANPPSEAGAAARLYIWVD